MTMGKGTGVLRVLSTSYDTCVSHVPSRMCSFGTRTTKTTRVTLALVVAFQWPWGRGISWICRYCSFFVDLARLTIDILG